jgi:hypothetical protein
MRAVKLIVLFLLLLNTSQALAGEIIVRGFYYGRNLYIRNPYLPQTKSFCIKQIYVNGKLIHNEVNLSAIELDLSMLRINDRVVVRIIFEDGCQPEIANIHVIRNENQFNFNQVELSSNELNWSTQSEGKEGFFVINRQRFGQWILVDTVKAKGSFDLNQYNLAVTQYPGQNEYMLYYFAEKDAPPIEHGPVIYESDEDPVVLYPDWDVGVIGFSKIVEYQILDQNGKTVAKGKGVNVNVRRLPRGLYFMYVENQVEELVKPK